MKHIKTILLVERQPSLFAGKHEKGGEEWAAARAVQDDQVGMFRVAIPRRRETPRYPNLVHISRQPRHLTPKLGR